MPTIYVLFPILRMGPYKERLPTWRSNGHGANISIMFYSQIICHESNGDQREKKHTL